MKKFLDKHPPLEPSTKPDEREAFNAALEEAERAIERRRAIEAIIRARIAWWEQLPQLAIDAEKVIAERNGDPTEDDPGED